MRIHYFDGNVPSGFVSLYTGKTLIMVATGLLGLFLPIFLYTFFHENIQYVMIYFAVGSFLYVCTIARMAQWMNQFGFRRALRVSTIFGAIFYIIFYFIDSENAWILIPLSVIALLGDRLLYWIPYRVDFSKFTDRRNLGKALGLFGVTQDVLGVFIPFVAGFLIMRFGFSALFMIAVFLYLFSAIPYIFIPQTYERFSWGYAETWKKLFSLSRRKTTFAFIADGAESVIGLVVWPIFIFQILQGNYLEVGALSALIIATTILLQLFVGKYIDDVFEREARLLHTSNVLYAVGWVVKMFVVTALHIFFVGAYHSIVKIFMRIPFEALTYEIAADQGHYVDEFTVLHEMAIHIGKIGMALLVIGVASALSLQWTFILAAAAALLLNLVRARHAEFVAPARVH